MHQHRHDEEQQAKLLSHWASNKFGLTAMHTDTDDNISTLGPVDIFFSQVSDIEYDEELLKKKVQIHDCSTYCLRPSTCADKQTYQKLHKLDK